ncbi:MAG: sigma-70 family RNA polymerase sigma factor [Pseudomonadota bacterium]
MCDREDRWSDWMQEAMSGNQIAYHSLLTEVADRVRCFARGRLSRSGQCLGDLEDIVQDVLIGLHTKRHTWDATRPIAPWVDAIIRYKTADALRRLRRRAILTDTLDGVVETIADKPSAVLPSEVRDLSQKLEVLPKRERGVVSALSIEGLSVASCAKRLGITEVAVRVAFHRGLQRLERLANGEPAIGQAQR